jgi:hypothetical protein
MMPAVPVALGGGVVLGLEDRIPEGIVAFGHRAGDPFAAWVGPDRQVIEAVGLRPAGAVRSMCTSESLTAVVGESRPTIVVGDFAGRPHAVQAEPFAPDDVYGLSEMADRFWVLCGDEDEFQLVLTGAGRLLAAECQVDSLNSDPPTLVLVGDEQELVVGADDGWVYVAGPVRSHPGPSAVLWRAGTDSGGWAPVPLDDPPDLVTDIHTSTSPLVAGVRSGRAVVHEIRTGRRRSLPDIVVDPAWPQVFVGYGSLAAQTPAGPHVWLDGVEHALPDGRLEASRTDGTSRYAWAVLDGALYQVG